MAQDSQQEKFLTLDIPQREGKEGYIGTVFSLYLRMGSILAEANFKDSDPRIYFFTKFMIGLIPGEKNRGIINNAMDKELEEIFKSNLNNEEKSRKRNEVCINYVGKIHDFIDKHIGVSRENRIGFAVKPK